MVTAKITSKGQITIPIRVRKALGVRPGDRIAFIELENGKFTVVPATKSVKSLKGIIKTPPKPVSLEEMDAAIRRKASEKT